MDFQSYCCYEIHKGTYYFQLMFYTLKCPYKVYRNGTHSKIWPLMLQVIVWKGNGNQTVSCSVSEYELNGEHKT